MPDQAEPVAVQLPYQVIVHPAVIRRCTVQPAGGAEREVYRQAQTHRFAPGERHPQQHTIRLLGGPHQRDLTLTVDDPLHHVARITVELYPHPRDPMSPARAPVETLTVENDAQTCPPHCDL